MYVCMHRKNTHVYVYVHCISTSCNIILKLIRYFHVLIKVIYLGDY